MSDEYKRADQDISDGIKTGIDTGKTAKNVASAAGKAATGNYAGAVKDILKDERLRTLAAFLAALTVLILFCVIFVVPMSIYEGVQAYVDSLTEQWKVDYYSGGEGRFLSFLKATAGLLSNLAQDIWTRLKSITTGPEDIDKAEDADLQVVARKEDLTTVYRRKIQAGKEKFTARQNTVAEIIERDAYDGQISSIMYSRYLSEFHPSGMEYDIVYSGYDDAGIPIIASAQVDIYDGVEVNVVKRKIQEMDVLKLLCLYTAQEGSSIENIQLSGFMKWLGYNGGNNRDLEFPLGVNENVRYRMKSWTGGFMPQYLEDEAAFLKETYREHGAALTDFLIQVDCPSLYSIRPQVYEELRADAGTATKTIIDYSNPVYSNDSDSGSDSYQYYDEDKGWVTVITGGPGYSDVSYNTIEIDYNYDITYHHVKYIIPVTVLCRNVSQAIELSGLWSGFLPWEEEIIRGVYSPDKGSGDATEAGW